MIHFCRHVNKSAKTPVKKWEGWTTGEPSGPQKWGLEQTFTPMVIIIDSCLLQYV